MEAPNDDFSLEEWLSFDDDNLEETFPYWTPPNLDNAHREELRFHHALPDDAVNVENLPPHYYLSSLGIDLLVNEPIDYITDVDPSGLDPGFETDSTTPSSSVDAWLTSTESVSADSLTSPETSFSPDFLDPTSPAHLSPLQSSPTNIVQMSAEHITNIPPPGGSVVPESLTITLGVQSSPSEASTTHQTHQERSSRTRLSKYVIQAPSIVPVQRWF